MGCCPKPKIKSAVEVGRALAENMSRALKTGEILAGVDISQKRITACQKCDRFTGMRCRECGCFVHLKAALVVSECPLGKW